MTVSRRRPGGERACPSTSMAVWLGNARVVASTLALALFVFALVASASAESPADGAGDPAARAPARLVAVPDLHGDLAHARRSFQLAGISEDGERWSAGANTHFVQTGDVVDRGERSIEIVRVLANLRREAENAGSRVTALLGNHELLTLQGDYRYVAREEIVRLGKDSLESKRLGGEEMGTGYGLRAYWTAGLMAWKKTFAPSTELGDEIRKNRPIATVIGEGLCSTLFSHAGLRRSHLKNHGDSIEALNAFAADSIAAVADVETTETKNDAEKTDTTKLDPARFLGSLDVFDVESPVWNRFWSDDWDRREGAERDACAELDSILALVGARRMVVGHTVQPRGMTTRCGGRLHLIDVGISDKYVGRGAAWTCESGTVEAHYDGRTVVLETPRAETSKPSEAKRETNGDASRRSDDGRSSSDAKKKGDSERVSTRVGGSWFGRTKTSGEVGSAAKKEL